MLIRFVSVAAVFAGCADVQTRERDEALTCDVGPPGAFGHACVKASDPLPLDAAPLSGVVGAPRIRTDERAYGVRLVPVGDKHGGQVRFTTPQTGTYQIYLGTPNIPFRVVRSGEELTPSCSSYIASSECSFLRRVLTVSLNETETAVLEIGPTDLRYVRVFVQTQVDPPTTCNADDLAEEQLACTAANDGAQAIDADSLADHSARAPLLALDAVYGVRLRSAPTTAGASTHGGVVRFQPPTHGDYELYLGTPNIPLRIYGDNPIPIMATQVCSRYMPSTECNLLRRGTRLSLRAGNTYWFEFGPTTNTYVRMALRQFEPEATLKLGPPVKYPSSNATTYLAAGDLDGDGAIDLVASAPDNANGATVINVLENLGGGAFDPVTVIPTSAPAEAVISDFNGDGIADIAAVAFDGQGPLPGPYLQGLGSFNYQHETWGNGRDFTRWLSAGDFDEDGTLDLVSAWADLQTTEGSGGFAIVGMPERNELDAELAFGSDTTAAIAGDFNGDGHQDVIAGLRYAGNVQLYLGDGTGNVTFASEAVLPDGTLQLAAFDLNDDGRTDLVQLGGSNTVSISYGTPEGLSAPQTLVGMFRGGIAVGDFDHDGRKDLAIGYINTIDIFVATDSGFVRAGTLTASSIGLDLVAADFNGDGFDDLAAPTFDSVTVWLSTP